MKHQQQTSGFPRKHGRRVRCGEERGSKRVRDLHWFRASFGGEGQLARHTASLISSLCQSNCSLGSSAPVTRSELISPKSTSPLLLFLSFLKYSIPCNKNHQTPPFAPSFFLCRTFPLQCLHNSSNSFQICSSRKRCMCEAF